MDQLFAYITALPTIVPFMLSMLISIDLLVNEQSEKVRLKSIIKVVVIIVLMAVVIPYLAIIPPTNVMWANVNNGGATLITTFHYAYSISIFVIPTIVLLIGVLKRKLDFYPAILMLVYISVITIMSFAEISFVAGTSFIMFIFKGFVPFMFVLLISCLVMLLAVKKKIGKIYILLIIVLCLVIYPVGLLLF